MNFDEAKTKPWLLEKVRTTLDDKRSRTQLFLGMCGVSPGFAANICDFILDAGLRAATVIKSDKVFDGHRPISADQAKEYPVVPRPVDEKAPLGKCFECDEPLSAYCPKCNASVVPEPTANTVTMPRDVLVALRTLCENMRSRYRDAYKFAQVTWEFDEAFGSAPNREAECTTLKAKMAEAATLLTKALEKNATLKAEVNKWCQKLQVASDERDTYWQENEALKAEVATLKMEQSELYGCLQFILAFYEPGQRHLDTEAWKRAESNARYAMKTIKRADAPRRSQDAGGSK